jgi:hypothetical protein
MRKRLTKIINKPILEVEVAVDSILFHLQDGSSEEIMCHSRYNHSPRIKFHWNRWNKLLSLLNQIEEQPIVFSYDVNISSISISQFTISF